MIKISRGFMLIIIGIILYFPVATVFQIILPPTYGLIFTLLLGPGFLIAGTILVVREIKSAKVKKEIVSDQSKFCGKCGKEASRENIFCTTCGTESKKS